MRTFRMPVFLALTSVIYLQSCHKLDDFIGGGPNGPSDRTIFSHKATIQVGGATASEISAFDPKTGKLFVVNVESNELSVFDITELEAPVQLSPIGLSTYGTPNSVAVHKGILAVAV